MGFVVPAWVRVNLAANRAGYVAGVAIAGSVEARERRMNYQKLAEKKDKKAQAHEVRARYWDQILSANPNASNRQKGVWRGLATKQRSAADASRAKAEYLRETYYLLLKND